MAIKWGFSTLGCPELGLMEAVDLAREYEFEAIEIRFLNDSPDLYQELSSFLAAAGSAGKIFSSGVDISGLNTSFLLGSSVPDHFEEFKRIARLADRLKAKYLRVFDGAEFGQAMTDGQKEAARNNYHEWKRWRVENGIRADMVLETHGSTASTNKLFDLFDIIGGSLPLIWDIHHTMVLGREDPEVTWSKLGPYIVHVHVKDSIACPDGVQPYTYVLPGRGRIPVRKVMSHLKSVGYSGVASLEWERKWHPELPPLREALRALYAASWHK